MTGTARSSFLTVSSALILQVLLAAAAGAAEAGREPTVLGLGSNQPPRVLVTNPSNNLQVSPNGDTYSLAPQVQDAEFTYFMSDTQSATTPRFDGQMKSAGTNIYGSAGGTIGIIESVDDLGDQVYRVNVEVTALNAQEQAEPWVSAEHAAEDLTSWRLDVGTMFGGTNPIHPGVPFQVKRSGILAYDSAGNLLGELNLNVDASNDFGLAGNVVIVDDASANIAGYDLAIVTMYWEFEDLSDEPGFHVSAGQSGAWYDPSHDGEGYVLQILSADSALIYWFTYDTEGKQRWMIGIGRIVGSRILFDELFTTVGGKFGPDFDPDDVVLSTWGTLELEFTSCDNAIANYVGPADFGSGSLNLQRLSRIWGENCDGSNSAPQSGAGTGLLKPGFTGSWYDPTHDGEGFTVEILDEETALIYWFTYDTDGNQAWMLAVARIEGSTIIADDVLITSGGEFGPNFDPDDVVVEHWGEATLEYESCATPPDSAGQMSYLPPADFGPESTQSLDRLASIDGLDCGFLSGR